MTEFVEIKSNGLAVTLLIFSSRNASNFDYRWNARNLPCNYILVRDPSNDGWYNQGVEGLGFSIDDVSASLREIIKRMGGNKLFVLGSSMGGYAAILFGSRLNADKVLAFSPQTSLNRAFPLAPPEGAPIYVPDLIPIVERNPETPIEIVASADDLADLYHLTRIAHLPNVRPVTVPFSEHWVALELHLAGKMTPILEHWFNNNETALRSAREQTLDPDFRQATIVGSEYFFARRFDVAAKCLGVAASAYPEHAGILHCYGICLWYEKRYQAAEAALRACLTARPAWAHAMHFLALAVVFQGRPEEAEPLFRLSAKLTLEPWAEAHFWIGFCLDQQGYFDAARQEMLLANKINPHLPDAVDWLTSRNIALGPGGEQVGGEHVS